MKIIGENKLHSTMISECLQGVKVFVNKQKKKNCNIWNKFEKDLSNVFGVQIWSWSNLWYKVICIYLNLWNISKGKMYSKIRIIQLRLHVWKIYSKIRIIQLRLHVWKLYSKLRIIQLRLHVWKIYSKIRIIQLRLHVWKKTNLFQISHYSEYKIFLLSNKSRV